jgi:F-type H+-transporting ATPase subunit gamma
MEFNKGLSQLIETLKSIAIAHYYAMEKRLKIFEEFLPIVESFFELINIDAVKHPFVNPKGNAQAIVAITTDTGFLGGLNMKVVDAALEEAQKMPTKIIVVGERGKMYVQGTGFPMVSFPGIQDEERRTQAWQLRDYILEKALAGDFDTVKVVYPRAVTFGVQRIKTVPFLPFRPADEKKAPPSRALDMILESNPRDIIEYLAYLWMGEMLYNIFGLSRLAEFSARYVHLDESAEKLKEEEKKVRLEYFRIRHELADRALRELISGRFVRGKK